MSSLTSRFLSKLLNNFVGLILGIVNASIIPRVLGPAHYGDFNFLRDSFQQIVSLIDLNSSSAFFVRSSRLKESNETTLFQFYFSLTVGLVLFMFVFFFHKTRFNHLFWPGQQIQYIYAAAILGYVAYLVTNLTNLSDSKELSVGTEMRRQIVQVSGVLLLLLLYFEGLINLSYVFAYFIVIHLLIIMVFAFYLKKKDVFDYEFNKLRLDKFKEILKYYYKFSFPLLVSLLVVFPTSYFDQWFLQLIDGSTSQGYYTLAMKVTVISILFTNSITPIFIQSIAKAHAQNDSKRIVYLFEKVNLFYFIAAFFSIFFFYHAKEIVFLIGGGQFKEATIPLMIMILYPVHQTYGRFCGDTLLSMERTAMYRNISIWTSIIGLIISYVLLAPSTFLIPGLNFGAVGLSLKMVITQIIAVNITLYMICKKISLSFRKYLFAQFKIIVPLFILGYLISLLEYSFKGSSVGVIDILLLLTISGLGYTIFTGIIGWMFPELLGLSREELVSLKIKLQLSFYANKLKK